MGDFFPTKIVIQGTRANLSPTPIQALNTILNENVSLDNNIHSKNEVDELHLIAIPSQLVDDSQILSE